MNTDTWPRANINELNGCFELREIVPLHVDDWGNFPVSAMAASILRERYRISTRIDAPFVRDGKVMLRVRAWTKNRTASAEGEIPFFVHPDDAEKNPAMALTVAQTKLTIEATLAVLRGDSEALPVTGEPAETGVVLPTQATKATLAGGLDDYRN